MKSLETVEINRIRTAHRIRRDLGDISTLMESLRRHGLLNPIVISRDYHLVAGQRRLEAARRLGWRAIACRVIDTDDPTLLLEIEMEENTARKDFNSDELADALLRLDHLKNPSWFRRLGRWVRRMWRRLIHPFRGAS